MVRTLFFAAQEQVLTIGCTCPLLDCFVTLASKSLFEMVAPNRSAASDSCLSRWLAGLS